jgi:hypothetical protein
MKVVVGDWQRPEKSIEMLLHEDGAISLKQGTANYIDYIKVYPEYIDDYWAKVFMLVQESIRIREAKNET